MGEKTIFLLHGGVGGRQGGKIYYIIQSTKIQNGHNCHCT